MDGFHVVNVGRMCLDQSTMLPATPWGVWEIIKRTGKQPESDDLLQLQVEMQSNKEFVLTSKQILVFQVFLHLGRMLWLQDAPRMWACPSPCYCIQTAVMRGLEVSYCAFVFICVFKGTVIINLFKGAFIDTQGHPKIKNPYFSSYL